MASSKKTGLLALLGLGALAYYKYKNASEEDKQIVKDKLNNAKENMSKWGNDLKSKASDVASQVQDKASSYAGKAEDKAADVASDANTAL